MASAQFPRARGARRAPAAALAAGLWIAAVGAAGPARAEEGSALQDVVKILQRSGMVQEEEAQRVIAKDAGAKPEPPAARLQSTQFSGDLLLRYEGFFFDHDARGIEATNRNRFQYRLRFGVTQQLGERLKLGVRLASGANNARSTNTTLGEGAGDGFAPDGIFFDRAFVEYKLQNSMARQSQIVVGKLPNPFLSTVGPDFLVFDSDLSLEGAFVSGSFRPTEFTRVFGALGGFIVDEVANSADPKLLGGQLGFETWLNASTRVGLRVSGYDFRALDQNFSMAGMMSGNLSSAFDDRARIGESYAFAQIALSELWPLLVFGQVVRNFTADGETVGGFRLRDEDTAYGLGFALGNPGKLVQLGLSYYRAEANSAPAQFPDGAPFDTVLNREGILAFAARRLNPNTDLRLSYSDIQEIRGTGGAMGPFGMSITNADRRRVVADIVFAF